MKEIGHKEHVNRNTSDSEIITVALIGAKYFHGNIKWLQINKPPLRSAVRKKLDHYSLFHSFEARLTDKILL
jgi:hypothetical protein